MKTNQTSFGKAIIKIVLVLCTAVVTNANAQTNLGDKGTNEALAAAKSSKDAETKAKNFQTAAAGFWKLSGGKPELKEERLKLALQYADSAKFYFMMEHESLQKQLAKLKEGNSMKETLGYRANTNGKDTANANWLITGIKNELKKFEKPQTQNATPEQNGTSASPEKKDSFVETEMTRLDLTGQSSKAESPSKTATGKEEKKSTSHETSKVIVTDAPAPTESKNIVSWETGVDAGLTWMSSPAAEPSLIHVTDPTFGTDNQVQALWNEIFKGMVFPEDNETKITNSPGWQLGFNAGCIINKNFEIKLVVGGGTFISKAELPVRVVKMVMPSSPSAPPTTQQNREAIHEKVLLGNFNSRLIGRIYFGTKIRGYAEAGGVVGLNHSDAVQITAADYSETKSLKQTIVYGGGAIGIGVNIPLTNILNFESGLNTDLLSVQEKFAVNIGLKAGVSVKF